MAKAASTEFSPARIYRADEVVPSDILPTGHDNLDLALCIGGLPMRRIITFYGKPQCGKTTLALEEIREAQYRGGFGIYFDFESKLEIPYVEQLGVDMDFFIHDHPEHIQEAMQKTEDYLKVLRAEDERAPLIIVWDSVSDAKSKAVMGQEWDATNWANEARVYSDRLSKYARMIASGNAMVIGIAQLRKQQKGQITVDKVGPGNCWLHKNAVVLSWVTSTKQKGKVAGPIGEVSTIEVSKNQVGIAWRRAELFLEYGIGYDQEFSTLQAAMAAGIVTKSGAWYSLGDDRIGQGKDAVIELFKTKPKLLQKIRTQLRAGITAKVTGYDPEELGEE